MDDEGTKTEEQTHRTRKTKNRWEEDRREADGWYFEFWWRRAEPIRAADWDCDHWLSSSGPVSVSMLLLSVSEASVCSVDMDEMSLADEDWEAEPDTTSDTGERRDSHDRVQWGSESNCDLKHEERKKKRQRIMEMAAAPTWTVFFHQSVLVPFLPVDHFLINKLCGKQEMLSLCTKRTARICGYIRSHKINFFLLKLYNNSCSLVSFFNYDRN